MSRIVVIGGVAAGMSAASQAKRRSPESEVVVFERGEHVSYGACGMPYNIEDPDRDIEDLVVITAERFRTERGLDVRTRHEVLAVDPVRKRLRVRDLARGREREEPWDRLVIATGASALRPPIPGLDRPGVFLLRELADGAALKQFIASARPRRAVIVGGGYIGLEMSEALRGRELEVTIVEKLEQVATGFAPEIAQRVAEELARHGVRVRTGVGVDSIESRGDGLRVRTSGGDVEADLVLVSVGVRPNVALAKDAGVPLGPTGAIAVDDHQRTRVTDVFAAGDCAEAHHLVSRAPAWIPLGTTANKQGRIAGANATGADLRFGGIVGTAGFKVFDLEVARTGLGSAEIARLGLDAVTATSHHANRGHGYPGASKLTTTLFVERGSQRLLGAQMVGAGCVATRVDVFATALHAGLDLETIESLDLAYAPPFAPVWDPILVAAQVARKQVA